MLLGGDLGGTKTLLALAEPAGAGLRIVRQQRYASADFAQFDDLLADFLHDAPPVSAACFGLAGPTDGQRAKLTYLPWQLDAAALAERFRLGRVSLLNDFAAAAHGLASLSPTDLLTLHPAQAVAQAPRVVLGAGTGLGVAGLIWQDTGYQVIAGEGGHFGFAPQTTEQGELWRWLFDQYGRVTSEDIISGPGLARIYAFLGGRPQHERQGIHELPQPAAIGQAALTRSDPRAIAAVRLWLECYGAFAGDLAMHWLAYGGVYLAGGIAAKLLPHCDRQAFVDAFLAKREHSDLVAHIPIQLITTEDLGLRGALAYATSGR